MGNATLSEISTFKICLVILGMILFVTSDFIDGCKGRNFTSADSYTSGVAAVAQRLEVKRRRNPLILKVEQNVLILILKNDERNDEKRRKAMKSDEKQK